MTKTNDPVGLPRAVDGRRHDRIPFRVPVRIITHGVLGDNSTYGVCTDISQGGVAFETEVDLFLQSTVELVFEIENEIIFRSSVRLLYRVGQRYGAYFGEPIQSVSLQNLLDQHACC
jgi:hypothetical protein